MVVVVLLWLGWLCAPLGALVLDVNNIKSSADAQGAWKDSQCVSDKDCNTRKFCLKPQDEKPSCATCRGLRRWCQRAAVCCPGTLCVNGESAQRLAGLQRSQRADTASGSLRLGYSTTGTL
eukprot:bmy_09713T0